MRNINIYSIFVILIMLLSCSGQDPLISENNTKPPEWCQNKTIYELNIRQFSDSGTFNAVNEQIPRLKKLGVGIIWLMPIHPIGEKNRKGSLGSPYSVRDYLDVNPNYGSKQDFSRLVKNIHKNGMYVIIDWVANHSAWDNPLITEHPDWYSKDKIGNIVSPVQDWNDVADFNYDNPEMRAYMLKAMEYWVKELDIDGFRCDVAEMVPLDFWQKVRKELDKIKPVFMLAEGESPKLHDQAFDMTYCWNSYWAMNNIAKGQKSLNYLDTLLILEKKEYPVDAMRMRFITNHDENAWNGTVYERLDGLVKSFSVLYCLIPGTPMLYSGQETGLKKRLEFFDKDPIDWTDMSLEPFYSVLMNLYQNSPALYKGDYLKLSTDEDNSIFAFRRWTKEDTLFAFINLSTKTTSFTPNIEGTINGTDIFSNEKKMIKPMTQLSLTSGNFLVLRNRKISN